MDAAIALFNEHRAWVMPLVFCGLVGRLAWEMRVMILEVGEMETGG